MRPANLKTKIFLDSGNPEETAQAKELLGFLDGQTTNPTLISRHPIAQQRLQSGQLFSAEEALGLYKQVVQQIADVIPDGAISIEVYADQTTTKDEMLTQADEFSTWIKEPFIKFPITTEGLAAAEQAVVDGIRVNMTLCFSQQQAAAVYAATSGAHKGHVFLSPFIGRLDDKQQRGTDLLRNIMQMYAQSDHHVEVLAASIRSVEHLVQAIMFGVDCLTAPLSILQTWAQQGMPMELAQPQTMLTEIQYEQIDLHKNWREYSIQHELTDMGLSKFVSDWNALIRE
jgi:transaldolase